MSIPIAETTITVLRVTETEPGDGRTFEVAATGIRAVIGSLSGSESVRPGGGRSVSNARLTCDVTDLVATDVITDDLSEDQWEVEWVEFKPGFGFLSHMEAGLVRFTGVAA